MSQTLEIKLHEGANKSGQLQLSHIEINKEYKNKWNVNGHDYVCLTRNGELVNNSLYRVGGLGQPNLKGYFMILKYVEDYYEDHITKDENNKRHLSGIWTIIDKNGIEKFSAPSYQTPSLIKNSCVYSLSNNFYHIDTNEFICSGHSHMKSNEFIFVESIYNKDVSKNGVYQISKSNGNFTLHPYKH